MFQKITFPTLLLLIPFGLQSISGQHYQDYGQQNYGPPQFQGANGCSSCPSSASRSPDQGPWNTSEFEGDAYQGACQCDECSVGAGCADQGRGSLHNRIHFGCSQPECADCNWGPVYVSLFAGGAFVDNFDTRNTFDNGMMNMLGIEEIGFSTQDGVAAGGSLGRYFYRQFRAEFEYTYRDNGIGDFNRFVFSDDLTTPQINDTLISSETEPANGNLFSNSFMANFVFDLKLRTVGCLNGYLGGGIGALDVEGEITTATAAFDVDDSAFAFQGIAGVNYPIRDRIDIFTEYRYLGADAISVTRTDMAGTASLGAFRFDSHNVVFGLRFLR